MKTHKMKLNPAPFALIRNKQKSIELRLYDEKRKLICVGDIIEFSNTEAPEETLSVKVLALHIFDSFSALYDSLPLTQCGYAEAELSTASPEDMEQYYSKEAQKQNGVVGIEFSVL